MQPNEMDAALQGMPMGAEETYEEEQDQPDEEVCSTCMYFGPPEDMSSPRGVCELFTKNQSKLAGMADKTVFLVSPDFGCREHEPLPEEEEDGSEVGPGGPSMGPGGGPMMGPGGPGEPSDEQLRAMVQAMLARRGNSAPPVA